MESGNFAPMYHCTVKYDETKSVKYGKNGEKLQKQSPH